MEKFLSCLKYNEQGLIPVIARDIKTREILMLAYANHEAIKRSIETGKAYYFSRSRNSLWLKGETSHNFQFITSIQTDCDKDTLIYNVEQHQYACHTGAYSCFFRELDPQEGWVERAACKVRPNHANLGWILDELYAFIQTKRKEPLEESFSSYLLSAGLDKILKKAEEGAKEISTSAKINPPDDMVDETAELICNLLVLLLKSGISRDDICNELHQRNKNM